MEFDQQQKALPAAEERRAAANANFVQHNLGEIDESKSLSALLDDAHIFYKIVHYVYYVFARTLKCLYPAATESAINELVKQIFDDLSGGKSMMYLKMALDEMPNRIGAVTECVRKEFQEDARIRNRKTEEVIALTNKSFNNIFETTENAQTNSNSIKTEAIVFFYLRIWRKMIGFLNAPMDFETEFGLEIKQCNNQHIKRLLPLLTNARSQFAQAWSVLINSHKPTADQQRLIRDDQINEKMETFREWFLLAFKSVQITFCPFVGPVILEKDEISSVYELFSKVLEDNIACHLVAISNEPFLAKIQLIARQRLNTADLAYVLRLVQIISGLIEERERHYRGNKLHKAMEYADILRQLYLFLQRSMEKQTNDLGMAEGNPQFRHTFDRMNAFLGKSIGQIDQLVDWWMEAMELSLKANNDQLMEEHFYRTAFLNTNCIHFMQKN